MTRGFLRTPHAQLEVFCLALLPKVSEVTCLSSVIKAMGSSPQTLEEGRRSRGKRNAHKARSEIRKSHKRPWEHKLLGIFGNCGEHLELLQDVG